MSFFSRKNKKESSNSMNTMSEENTNSAENETIPSQEPELQDAQVEQQDPIAKLEAALSESQDKYLRLVAEFENYKKRVSRDRLELSKMAGADILLALLPVMDDFERALKAGQDASASEGVQLIYNKLKSTLESKGVKAMVAVGETFDAELHDAIVQAPAPSEDAKGKVLDEITKGYYLNDKVLRHAQVVVAI